VSFLSCLSFFSSVRFLVGEFLARLYVACRDLGNKIEINVAETLTFVNA
jgi:hypothetical protein